MEPLDYSIFPEKTIVPASFGQRLGAVIIDGILLGVAGFFIGMAFDDISGTYSIDVFSVGRAKGYHPLTIMLKTIMGWLYHSLLESGNGQATLGKKGLGIRVTNMNGGRLSFGQATGRYFGKWISAVLLFFGYFMMLWDKKSQTLHDKMAGALVVN
jgi:uncharacterized RDD family membrane protein YckC